MKEDGVGAAMRERPTAGARPVPWIDSKPLQEQVKIWRGLFDEQVKRKRRGNRIKDRIIHEQKIRLAIAERMAEVLRLMRDMEDAGNTEEGIWTAASPTIYRLLKEWEEAQ